MFERSIDLPHETLVLWGPRQTGKTTFLKSYFSDSIWVDLLKADEFRRYLERPEILREELAGKRDCHVVVDEVQKVPALLDEVHWLHENQGIRFALCGSSARKVRRGQANLLGGRALRYQLFGLSAHEIGEDFDLVRALNHGWLPRHYTLGDPRRRLNAYVGDYLREEVAAEGLVRKLPAFSDFLRVAALGDTELTNMASIGRACGVSMPTVRSYFEILTDTLLGSWLPAYRRRPKRRVIGAPKFYFADVGVVNSLARRGRLEPGSELFGKAFESWVLHEVQVASAYQELDAELSYWRLASGVEVDLIVDDMRVAIEAKSSRRITSDHLRGLRSLVQDHPGVERRLVVCLEPRRRVTGDGIEILPYDHFVRELWEGLLSA